MVDILQGQYVHWFMLALVGVQLLIPWIIKTLVASVTDPSATLDKLNLVRNLTLVALAVYIGKAVLQFLRSYMIRPFDFINNGTSQENLR